MNFLKTRHTNLIVNLEEIMRKIENFSNQADDNLKYLSILEKPCLLL